MPNLLVESVIEIIPRSAGGARFAGTLAPTLEIEIDGDRPRLVDLLTYGYTPAMTAAP